MIEDPPDFDNDATQDRIDRLSREVCRDGFGACGEGVPVRMDPFQRSPPKKLKGELTEAARIASQQASTARRENKSIREGKRGRRSVRDAYGG